MNLSSGCIVEFIAKGSIPEAAVVLNTSGSNVRLMLTNGKETNVSEKKILLSSNRSLTGVSDKEACKQNLIRFNNARKEIAEKINLAEIHELLVEDQRFYELDEIAGFLYDPSDYDSSAALLRKLCEDHIYFKSKNNAYQPVSEEALKQALELQQKKEQQEKEEGVRIEDAQLYVKSVVVDGGRMLKRIQPAPRGMAHRIRKRSNHVTIIIDDKRINNNIEENQNN